MIVNNPKIYAIKKAMYDFLNERYGRNDDIIERLASSLQTENDVHNFMKLMVDVYETGYLKSVSDHKDQLTKLGLNAKVVEPSKVVNNKIFKN